MHFGCGGEGEDGVRVLVFFFFFLFLHHNLTSVLSAQEIYPDTVLQKSRIKVDDISQRSLQRNKINVQSKVFIKGLPVLRS